MFLFFFSICSNNYVYDSFKATSHENIYTSNYFTISKDTQKLELHPTVNIK